MAHHIDAGRVKEGDPRFAVTYGGTSMEDEIGGIFAVFLIRGDAIAFKELMESRGENGIKVVRLTRVGDGSIQAETVANPQQAAPSITLNASVSPAVNQFVQNFVTTPSRVVPMPTVA